jgi:hypothetical protein
MLEIAVFNSGSPTHFEGQSRKWKLSTQASFDHAWQSRFKKNYSTAASVMRMFCEGVTSCIAANLSALSLDRFGNNAENRYIPRIWRDFFDSLALESDTDKFRVKPVIPVLEKRERAIEVTTTHTKTVPLIIEGEERSDDNIEPPGFDRLAVYRFPETEVIHCQSRLRERLAKMHVAAAAGYRQENPLFCAPRALDDCTRIYFVPRRNVTADIVATQEVAAVEKSISNYSRCAGSLDCGHRTARVSCAGAQAFRVGQWIAHWYRPVRGRRRPPPVPLRAVALEPEQQVGSAVAATGFPQSRLTRFRPCSNAADSARPRGYGLGSKGFQVAIEHCRGRQILIGGGRVRNPVAGIPQGRYRHGHK